MCWFWRSLHAVIIVNFVVEIAYAAWMIFFVVTPGVSGPLGASATQIPHELMTTRRLYAIEFWIATAGLAIYLAVTEILPRRLGAKSECCAAPQTP